MAAADGQVSQNTNSAQTESKKVDNLYAEIQESLINFDMNNKTMAFLKEYLKTCMDYSKGLVSAVETNIVFTYMELRKDNPYVTEEETKKARILEWCLQLWKFHNSIVHDVMHQKTSRANQLPWHQCNYSLGIALNDSAFLGNCVHQLLRRYFRREPCYPELMEQFHEMKLTINEFTPNKYTSMSRLKRGPLVYASVGLAMNLAGMLDEESQLNVKEICYMIGQSLQEQEDYMYCFGKDNSLVPKTEDSVFDWFLAQSLSRATSAQREIIMQNYEQNNPEKITLVKQLYSDLELEKHYVQHRQKSDRQLLEFIDVHRGILPKNIFLNLLNSYSLTY